MAFSGMWIRWRLSRRSECIMLLLSGYIKFPNDYNIYPVSSSGGGATGVGANTWGVGSQVGVG